MKLDIHGEGLGGPSRENRDTVRGNASSYEKGGGGNRLNRVPDGSYGGGERCTRREPFGGNKKNSSKLGPCGPRAASPLLA